jgi:two-component system response regulator HydG
VLERLSWPGGERELELWVERALVLCGDGPITHPHVAPPTVSIDAAPVGEPEATTDRSLASLEADLIRRVFEDQGGNVSRCAQVLGIHRSTLHAKLRALRLR